MEKSQLLKNYEKARIKTFLKFAKFKSLRRKADKQQDVFINFKEQEINLKQLLINKN